MSLVVYHRMVIFSFICSCFHYSLFLDVRFSVDPNSIRVSGGAGYAIILEVSSFFPSEFDS